MMIVRFLISSLKDAIQANDYILLVVPTAVVRGVLKQINEVINSKKVFINASKGIEPDTFKRVSEIVNEEINKKYLAKLLHRYFLIPI